MKNGTPTLPYGNHLPAPPVYLIGSFAEHTPKKFTHVKNFSVHPPFKPNRFLVQGQLCKRAAAAAPSSTAS